MLNFSENAEMKVHDTQLAQVAETLGWYIAKCTGEQSYIWMETSIRKLLYQAYLLAIEVTKKAKKSHQCERRDNAPTPFVVQKRYWDSEEDGFSAA